MPPLMIRVNDVDMPVYSRLPGPSMALLITNAYSLVVNDIVSPSIDRINALSTDISIRIL